MSTIQSFKRLLLALGAVLLLCSALSASALADPFGELTQFGSRGTGKGQFIEHLSEAIAFGVDPTDNSIYVGDKPEEHVFRIQKFSENGTFLASVSFTPREGLGAEPESGIEGIAVDPVEKRIYVLATQSRGNETQVLVDPEIPAAGALYAFSTTPVGEKLEPAPGTKEVGGVKEGLLANIFHPQSKEAGVSLLEPSGIAVDPTSHDVLVMGKEDRGEAVEPSLRVALERVSSKGAFVARWVDKASSAFFESSEEATSPVVSSAGKVYVIGGALEVAGERPEEIVEVPANFGSSEAPKPLVKFNPGPNEFVTFPGIPAPSNGAGLAIAPDGTLYAYAKIHQTVGESTFAYPGVVAFSSGGEELGWTGGQSAQLGLGKCTISFEGHPMVAAGKEGRLFVFDPNPEAPHVLEFGAGGTGCPVAKSSALAASVKGEAVGVTVQPGSEVKLSSAVTEANALGVDWEIEGKKEAETVGQHQTPEWTHTFATEGTFTVKERIHTDNLVTPELVEERTFTVGKLPPIAAFSAKTEAKVGESNIFDGKTSKDRSESTITEYIWEFGDGASKTTTTPSVEHTFTAAGSYVVTLRVKDALELTSAPVTHEVKVTSPSSGGGGGGGTGSTGTTNTVTTSSGGSTGGSTGGGGGGGVLDYRASLAKTSLTVARSGKLVLQVSCLGSSSCTGTVTVRTLTAVKAGKHKAILTLATGAFVLAGGHTKLLSLHLSAAGRALLARTHLLRARATILAHDSAGKLHTTLVTVTLRPAKHH
jgi:PKD domain